MAQMRVKGCLRHYILQAHPWHVELRLNQLKALALRNLSGILYLRLPHIIKLPQLEYLEMQTTTKPRPGSLAIIFANADIPQAWAEQVDSNRPFMLAMSRNEGMPDTPANASSHDLYAKLQQQNKAAAGYLERVFGPQDRHNLVSDAGRVLQYIPMRVQDMRMEIVYCNAQSRKLANQQLMTTKHSGADCMSQHKLVWATRGVKCSQTISKCKNCERYRCPRS